ncbi:hypothetical protein [Cohnella cellulosilytica]|uniref:YtkA-like domain-containing protein n=1 Tax=Cohnella cellulosilytica TaxID=986710 RepID=A0ABW2FEW1_9BACL
MKMRTTGWLTLIVLAVWCLSGCASSKPGDQDPRAVKVELTTDPAAAKAGTDVKLITTVTGLVDEKNTIVQYEIRKADHSGLPELLEEVDREGATYSANFSFAEGATYDVYIHIYNGELHITKKKSVEVTP